MTDLLDTWTYMELVRVGVDLTFFSLYWILVSI